MEAVTLDTLWKQKPSGVLTIKQSLTALACVYRSSSKSLHSEVSLPLCSTSWPNKDFLHCAKYSCTCTWKPNSRQLYWLHRSHTSEHRTKHRQLCWAHSLSTALEQHAHPLFPQILYTKLCAKGLLNIMKALLNIMKQFLVLLNWAELEKKPTCSRSKTVGSASAARQHLQGLWYFGITGARMHHWEMRQKSEPKSR